MKVTIKPTQAWKLREYHSIRAISVEPITIGEGDQGDLIILRTMNEPPIRVKRWDWDGFTVSKDTEGEKA